MGRIKILNNPKFFTPHLVGLGDLRGFFCSLAPDTYRVHTSFIRKTAKSYTSDNLLSFGTHSYKPFNPRLNGRAGQAVRVDLLLQIVHGLRPVVIHIQPFLFLSLWRTDRNTHTNNNIQR